MAQMLQKPVFALPGCQRMSVNTLLCDTLGLADDSREAGDSRESANRFAQIGPSKGFVSCLTSFLLTCSDILRPVVLELVSRSFPSSLAILPARQKSDSSWSKRSLQVTPGESPGDPGQPQTRVKNALCTPPNP